MINQRIMSIDAKSLFRYFPKKKNTAKEPFCFDTRKRAFFSLVAKEIEMEECPLLHQFLYVLDEDENRKQFFKDDDYRLYDQFLIMDFGDIFLPIDEKVSEAAKQARIAQQENVKDLIENGFDVKFDAEYIVHMMPFDKSNSMSRKSRISFVNERYVKQLNERLNLGMDFSEIPVVLSKYYAYRGLYLSTSSRVEHKDFKLTPETLIIIKDKRKKQGKETYTNGNSFERDVNTETAVPGKNPGEWNFQEPVKKKILGVKTPHDGEGFISPDYSNYINEALGIHGANSFQVRLPFAKGMLHQVDVSGFIDEFSIKGKGDKQYLYEDAFGIERDLRKAHIFLSESMFKGKKWLEKHCKDSGIEDPMQYYCEMIEKFHHGFYVSGTNLPYGHSNYTHLSYQTINTLAFQPDQFERIIENHGKFIENPIEFLKGWDEIEKEDVVIEDNENSYCLPNWKRAVLKNPNLSGDTYIKEQLENTQKGILSKIALGKILVEGQTRYLCRDLLPLLTDLLRDEVDINKHYLNFLYSRFYMPMGKDDGKEKIKLEFDKYYAFFRNPHLSRNEQYMMRAFVLPDSKENYEKAEYKDGKKRYEKYVEYVKLYDKYFGHLTGIVMVPRGSSLPLCLGGADFDGDLVSVVFNQDVVDAVKKGVYDEVTNPNNPKDYERKLPVIEIPSTEADEVFVPEYVEYDHIKNTFSNYIGRISNAAIGIGQVEYDRNRPYDATFDATKPTCEKCTLLTGLEIDAAKNGCHPNLDIILNNNNHFRSAYLDFQKQFKKLKEEKNFHLQNLSIKKTKTGSKEKQREVIEISAKNCDTKVKWYPAEAGNGTYINDLPKYFLSYYDVFKKKKTTTEKFELAQKPELTEKDKKVIEDFNTTCDGLFDLYSFYKNTFLQKLTNEKNKSYYAVENTEKLIMQRYDKDQVDEILFQILPEIKRKIESVIPDDSAMKDIRNRINSMQWQFQPRNQRGQVLEQIIGNGFKESDLTEKERNLLYHFNQHGYKLLWLLMDLIEGPVISSYDDLYEKTKEEREKHLSEEFKELEAVLNRETRCYYENNASNIGQTLYALCLNELKNIINRYSSEVDNKEKLVVALYEKTKSKTTTAKFFWEVFTWEEIKFIVEEKGEDGLC